MPLTADLRGHGRGFNVLSVREAAKLIERLIGEDVELVTRLAPRVGPALTHPGQTRS